MEQWNRKNHIKNYLDVADLLVVGRRDSLEILKSFYRHHYADCFRPVRLLDLGCGDAVLTRELLIVDPELSVTLLDGSGEMISRARQLLPDTDCFSFVCASFEQIIEGQIRLPHCDFVVSSLAIHHLVLDQKKRLFERIFKCLSEGGYFINIDAVKSPFEDIEQWYLKLWMEGAYAHNPSKEAEAIFEEMYAEYIKPAHYSRLDTLEDQLRVMEEAGFRQVECFYKRGLFALYAGKR